MNTIWIMALMSEEMKSDDEDTLLKIKNHTIENTRSVS